MHSTRAGPVVARSTTAIFRFPGGPSGIRRAYLVCAKLDQCNFLEFSFIDNNLDFMTSVQLKCLLQCMVEKLVTISAVF